MNISPWLAHNFKNYPSKILEGENSVDILIIGGGIAGVTTAYFLLKNTNLKVGLVEATKVANGATGHNAGQVVGYFERPFTDIAREYGIELALNGQRDLYKGWDLLDQIVMTENLQTPYSKVTGYAGVTSWEQTEAFLEKKLLRQTHGLQTSSALIAIEALESRPINKRFTGLFQVVTQKEISDLLETKNPNFIAAFGTRKGVVNSAQLSCEIFSRLAMEYSDRLQTWEHSPINEVILNKYNTLAVGNAGQIVSEKVVLCTNGFEHISINNQAGSDINSKFRDTVVGRIGYMAGYIERSSREPMATSYITGKTFEQSTSDAEPYFYITRRKFSQGTGLDYNLVCIGGPETELPDTSFYQRQGRANHRHYQDIENFLHSDYRFTTANTKLDFKWHGLMGYTKNGLRMIGPEPYNPNLLYNLGCNGVGILPSIFGSWKISQFILNKVYHKSIFDPV